MLVSFWKEQFGPTSVIVASLNTWNNFLKGKLWQNTVFNACKEVNGEYINCLDVFNYT